ncbi:MAG: electron transfer flavoprotein subunit alpha/FixB family protein [Candidatus Hodarchaeales archaeon]
MSESISKRKSKPIFDLVDLRGGYRGILTLTELVNDQILDVSREILGEGTRMKEKLNTTLGTVIIGSNVTHHAKELIEYGADKVIIIEHPDLENYITRPYTSAIIQVIKKYQPEIFLYGATTTGRDLAPRIAGRLEVGLSADCIEFNIGEYQSRPRKQRYNNVAYFIRPSFGESKLATIIGPWTFPQMATARPGAMNPLKRDPDRTGEIVQLEVTIPKEDLQVKILETVRGTGDMEQEGVDPNCNIIVAGGYGIGKEGFDQLKVLVDLLISTGHNASLGASRKAVEAGYISSNYQIGQTGKTVRPHWYFAVGIAGAIQHLAGIKYCKKVVAINKDPGAPIFEHSDYGLVGRYEDIIPQIITAVKNENKFPLL